MAGREGMGAGGLPGYATEVLWLPLLGGQSNKGGSRIPQLTVCDLISRYRKKHLIRYYIYL